jgi:tRNA threonylcarbamoyladenosine biosynthesis protein TsaB
VSMKLVLDTALDACTAALVQTDAIVAVRQQIIGKGHAELLPLLLAELLADVDAAAITGIAVCIGPGSFTGLRVGLAAAKALALAWAVPVLGASSLAAVAHAAQNASKQDGPLLVVHDAKRGQVFAQSYGSAALPDVQALSPAAAADIAHAHGCAIAGSGVALLPAALRRLDVPPYPAPLSLLACAQLPPEPLYVRPPDAKTLAQRGL